jgi:hypothetical protein
VYLKVKSDVSSFEDGDPIAFPNFTPVFQFTLSLTGKSASGSFLEPIFVRSNKCRKVFSLKSGVMGNHRKKTAKIRGGFIFLYSP